MPDRAPNRDDVILDLNDLADVYEVEGVPIEQTALLRDAIALLREPWRADVDDAPMDTPVFVRGGIGLRSSKHGGQWLTLSDWPWCHRAVPIEWPVTVWMPIPLPPPPKEEG